MPGILHADAAHRRFRFTTHPPAARLAPFVTHFWVIHWDLRGQPPHEQHVLPYPAVNLTFLPGDPALSAAGGGGRRRVGRLDVAALAATLGYADQAHLTRDFTALVGEPPARYARAQPGPA